MALEMFIKNDKVMVTGLVLAGSAQFKTELGQSDMFDQRLQVSIFIFKFNRILIPLP
jgi:peptide chain release factor subunit 1